MKKKFLLIICAVMAIAIMMTALAGCTVGKEGDVSPSDGLAPKNASSGTIVVGDVSRKVYYTVELTVYVSDLDAMATLIKTKTAEKGGYIQNSHESESDYASYYTFTARIPTEKLDEFEAEISGAGKVADRYVTTTDITTEYVSAQSRIDALEAERTALENLLSTAAEMDDIIALSKRISEINGVLGALEREINEYDSLVDYSTVYIRVYQEEEEPVDDSTFAQKMRKLFIDSFKSMGKVAGVLVVIATAVFPYLLVLSVIGGIILGIIVLVRVKKGLPAFPKRRVRVNNAIQQPAEPVAEAPEKPTEPEERKGE